MTRCVASFTDAWIETRIEAFQSIQSHLSHLLQMRGLKHVACRLLRLSGSRIFYRCVD